MLRNEWQQQETRITVLSFIIELQQRVRHKKRFPEHSEGKCGGTRGYLRRFFDENRDKLDSDNIEAGLPYEYDQ